MSTLPLSATAFSYPQRCPRGMSEKKLLFVLRDSSVSQEQKTKLILELFGDSDNICSFKKSSGHHRRVEPGWQYGVYHRDDLAYAMMESKELPLNERDLETLAGYIIRKSSFNFTKGDWRRDSPSRRGQMYSRLLIDIYPQILSNKQIGRNFLLENGHVENLLSVVNGLLIQQDKRYCNAQWREEHNKLPLFHRHGPDEVKMLVNLLQNPSLIASDFKQIYRSIQNEELRKALLRRKPNLFPEEVSTELVLQEYGHKLSLSQD